MSSSLDLKNIFDYLKAECENAGTNISELCLEAKVNRQNIEKWKGNNPKTLDTLALLLGALEKIKKGKKVIAFPGGKNLTRS